MRLLPVPNTGLWAPTAQRQRKTVWKETCNRSNGTGIVGPSDYCVRTPQRCIGMFHVCSNTPDNAPGKSQGQTCPGSSCLCAAVSAACLRARRLPAAAKKASPRTCEPRSIAVQTRGAKFGRAGHMHMSALHIHRASRSTLVHFQNLGSP